MLSLLSSDNLAGVFKAPDVEELRANGMKHMSARQKASYENFKKTKRSQLGVGQSESGTGSLGGNAGSGGGLSLSADLGQYQPNAASSNGRKKSY